MYQRPRHDPPASQPAYPRSEAPPPTPVEASSPVPPLTSPPAESQTTEPQTTEPQTTEPQTTEPQTTEPQTTEPQRTEPLTTEPQATESLMTEPPTTEPQTTPGMKGEPGAWGFVKQLFQEFSDDEVPQTAAALAYYAIFSLAPVLVIAIAVAGFVIDPQDVEGMVEGQLSEVLGADAARQVQTMIVNVQQSSGGLLATVLSLLVLVIGATGVVAQLQVSLNKAWDVKVAPEAGGVTQMLWKRFLSLLLVIGIGALLLVAVIASSLASAIGGWAAEFLPAGWSGTFLMGLNLAVSFAVITVLFAAIFKFLPDAKVSWRHVGIGAVVSALLFVIGQFALSLYLGRSSVTSAYGAAGSLVVILIWFYYSSMILLIGAEFTQLWARRSGNRIEPAEGAVAVV